MAYHPYSSRLCIDTTTPFTLPVSKATMRHSVLQMLHEMRINTIGIYI